MDDAGYIYLLFGGGYYKIGRTIDIDKRITQIAPKLPFKIELMHYLEVDDAPAIETFLHNHFADRRQEGEWFTLDESDVEWLMQWDGEIEGISPCHPKRNKITAPEELADKYGKWILFTLGILALLLSTFLLIGGLANILDGSILFFLVYIIAIGITCIKRSGVGCGYFDE